MTRRNLIFGLIIFAVVYLLFRQPAAKNLTTGKVTELEKQQEISNIFPEPITGKPQVEISTSKGKIVLELRPDLAPKTVANFLGKWSRGDCDNLTWHRVEDWVVQGCDPKGDGTGGASNLPTETSEANFTAGSLGVARRSFPKDVSNDSQFFIVKKDSSFLNGDYTYFGKVVSGMEVINNLTTNDKILSSTVLSK